VRRWATQGKLPASRTVDGWLVDVEFGQVAATDHAANGQTVGHDAVTGGQLAVLPVSHLAELEARAEASAFLAGRVQVLQERVEALESRLEALPAPTTPQEPLQRDSHVAAVARTKNRPSLKAAWWRFWAA
jgi:hypothetical protein